MSTLTADRIRNHASKLGLTHLTETITELVEQAEAAQIVPRCPLILPCGQAAVECDERWGVWGVVDQ